MNNFVPDFDTDHHDDYLNFNPSSSSLNLPRKSILGEEEEEDDELMELLWQNGQVVLQNPRLHNNTKKPSSSHDGGGGGGEASLPPPPPLDQNLFIQEDEMTSWLHYPIREDDLYSDLLFSSSPCATPTTTSETHPITAAKPPVPSVKPPVRNFSNFSRLRGNFTGANESRPSNSKAIVRESTRVNPSSATAAAAAAAESVSGLTRRTDGNDSRITTVDYRSNSAVASSSAVPGIDRKGKAVATTAPASEIPCTTSFVASMREVEPVIVQPETEKTINDHRKRKEREAADETKCRSELQETKKARGSTSSKRSRAAEVHNLSERKRRDRINDRMKALQELIPRCNKSDKASMLDEAIEYMKTLQLQVQMMSMGCNMMPMMYSGMQQYMPPHMAMGVNPSLPPLAFMPFPNMLAPQRPMPTPNHMGGSGQHYPVHGSDPSRVFVPNQQCDPNWSQPQYPGYMNPYNQFHSLHPTQQPQFQSQATSYPSSSRVSSSKESENQGNHTTKG